MAVIYFLRSICKKKTCLSLLQPYREISQSFEEIQRGGRFRYSSLRERNCQIVGFAVREVHCRIGNKRFVFQLHSTWPSKPLVKILRSSYIRKLRSNTSIRNRNRILCLSLVPAKDTSSAPKWKCWVSTSDCDLKRVNWRAQTECIPY